MTNQKTSKPVRAAVAVVGMLGALGVAVSLKGAPSSEVNASPPTAPQASSVPATSASSAPLRRGSIYVEPGAPKPRWAPPVTTRGGIWYEAGKTRAGGVAAHVDPSFYPHSVATVGSDGKVQLDCVKCKNHTPHQHYPSLTRPSHSKHQIDKQQGRTSRKH